MCKKLRLQTVSNILFPTVFLLLQQADVTLCPISLHGCILVCLKYITYTATCSYMLPSGKFVILVADVYFSPNSDYIFAQTCLIAEILKLFFLGDFYCKMCRFFSGGLKRQVLNLHASYRGCIPFP